MQNSTTKYKYKYERKYKIQVKYISIDSAEIRASSRCYSEVVSVMVRIVVTYIQRTAMVYIGERSFTLAPASLTEKEACLSCLVEREVLSRESSCSHPVGAIKGKVTKPSWPTDRQQQQLQ